MKQFLMIGMGSFGRILCSKLSRTKCEILAVDKDPARLEDVLSMVTEAKVGDCTREATLRSFGVKNFDVCFVCIGGDFLTSLQVTSLLKELGAPRVITKANEETEGRFLLRNGADQIIYPENDIAERIAIRESSDKIMDAIEISDDLGIFEITPMKSWIGESLKTMNFRARYNLTVFAVRRADGSIFMPDALYTFNKDDHVMVAGTLADVRKITK